MKRQSKYTGQQVLAQIPDDLKAIGWEWVHSESNAVTTMGSAWHKAVYVRPFEQGIDDEGAVTIVYQNDRRWVRVSTAGNHSVSWDAAHEEAIELMREADAKRQESTQTP
jgi:O-methyltransferase involved in polyketide biosynthesis